MTSFQRDLKLLLDKYAPFLSSHGFILIPIGLLLLVAYLTIKLFHYLEHEDNYKPLDKKKRSRSKPGTADDSDESSDPMDGRDGRDVTRQSSVHDHGADTPQVLWYMFLLKALAYDICIPKRVFL